jgi:hypothetical protein
MQTNCRPAVVNRIRPAAIHIRYMYVCIHACMHPSTHKYCYIYVGLPADGGTAAAPPK